MKLIIIVVNFVVAGVFGYLSYSFVNQQTPQDPGSIAASSNLVPQVNSLVYYFDAKDFSYSVGKFDGANRIAMYDKQGNAAIFPFLDLNDANFNLLVSTMGTLNGDQLVLSPNCKQIVVEINSDTAKVAEDLSVRGYEGANAYSGNVMMNFYCNRQNDKLVDLFGANET